MSNDQRTDRTRSPTRRSTLQALGTLLATGGAVGAVTAQQDAGSFRVTQGGETFTVEPLSGDLPVEELYSYRLPDEYVGTGVHDVDGGPYYESVGTRPLQRESTTITFLYDGPNGLSLVTVHGRSSEDDRGGGSVTWDLLVAAGSAEWLVKDDEYWVRETGERASTNYDNWDTDGDEHRIDWTWSGEATDGGVLGYLDAATALVVDPHYNGEATLYGEHYAGEVTDWQFLSGSTDDPDRISVALDEPLAITGPDVAESPLDGGDDVSTEDEGDESTDEPGETEDEETEDGEDEREDEDEEEEPEEEEDEDEVEEEVEDEEEEEDDDDEDDDDDDDDDEADVEIEVEVEDEVEDTVGKAKGLGEGNGEGKGRGKGNGHDKGRGNGHAKGRGKGHGK